METNKVATTTGQSIDEDLKAQLLAEAFKQDWSKYSPLICKPVYLCKDVAYGHHVSDLYLITPYSVELAHRGGLTKTYFRNGNNWFFAKATLEKTIYGEDDPYEVRPDHHYYSVYASLMPGHIYHDPTSPEVQVYTNRGTFEPAKLILGGLKIVRNDEGKYGMADAEGNLKIPCQFDYVDYPFCTDKFALVAKFNKDNEKGRPMFRSVFGVIDANGQEIVPFKYWDVKWVNNRYLRFPHVVLDVVEDNIIRFDDKDEQQLFDEGKKYYDGNGVTKDYYMAFFYYEEAAYRGHAGAENEVGNCYRFGKGVKKSYSGAMSCYAHAAAKGNADALNNLGDCYRYGYDTLQNYSKAVRFYREAAELGNTSAMNNLGYCYQLGLGVKKDLFTAIKYYHKAAVKQNAKAHFYAWVIAFKMVMAVRKTSSKP